MNALSQIRVNSLLQYFRSGESYRFAAKKLSVSDATVWKYFQIFMDGKEVRRDCPCGLPAGHIAWCSYRVARSPKRQRVLRRWKRWAREIGDGDYYPVRQLSRTYHVARMDGNKTVKCACGCGFICVRGAYLKDHEPNYPQKQKEKMAWRKGKMKLQQIRKLLNNPNP